jgi:hypothetical protein
VKPKRLRTGDWAVYLWAALLPALAYSWQTARAADVPEPGPASPCASREHVFVYLLNGLDPLGLGDLRGVAEAIRGWGFPHTHYGQFFHYRRFQADIECVHATDPGARFVIIGFSAGAIAGQRLTWELLRHGVPVHLQVYLDGKWVRRSWPEDEVGPPPPTVNVIAPGYAWSAASLPWAQNLCLTEGWHFGAPTNAQTLDLLACRLNAIAAAPPTVPACPPPRTGSCQECPEGKGSDPMPSQFSVSPYFSVSRRTEK